MACAGSRAINTFPYFIRHPQGRRVLNNTSAAAASIKLWCSGRSSSPQLPLAYPSTAAQNCLHARVVCTFPQEGMRPVRTTVLLTSPLPQSGRVRARSACAQKQCEQHSADGKHGPQHLKVVHLHACMAQTHVTTKAYALAT